jgi:hypothetical protein
LFELLASFRDQWCCQGISQFDWRAALWTNDLGLTHSCSPFWSFYLQMNLDVPASSPPASGKRSRP